MSARLRVRTRGPGRACIVGTRSEPAIAEDIERWLRSRPDVVRIEKQLAPDVIRVEYDDGTALSGRFLRALEDQLFALRRRTAPSFDIRPVHSRSGRVRLRVTGLTSPKVAALSLRALSLPGVIGTRYVRGSNTTLIRFDAVSSSEARIVDALRVIDLTARPRQRPAPLRWGAASATSFVLVLCVSRVAPFPVLAVGVTLSTLRPLRRTVEALAHRSISVDLLDVVATFAALATGRPATAAFVIWMVAVGDLLLDLSANSLRTALSTIMERTERDAHRICTDGTAERVSSRRLVAGDRILVHTGEAVAADGCIVSGQAEVDEKALTGESRLLSRGAGDYVHALSVVVEGQVVVEVQASGKDTEAAKIETILSSVGNKPLTLQRDALAFAGKLVLPAIGIGLLAAALGSDVTRLVCVLITDFGTGIRIVVPVGALAAMAAAGRDGVMFKGAQYLERLSKADRIVFDKTGTLTKGVPEIVEVVPAAGFNERQLVELGASAEAAYDHPVARALKSYARREQIALAEPEPGSEEYAVGRGLSVRVGGRHVRVGKPAWFRSQHLALGRVARHLTRLTRNQISTVCVAVGHTVAGLIGYSDATRPESAAMVRRLRADGTREVVLLSGDSPQVVDSVARDMGIADAVGALLPGQKADYIGRLRREGHVVAMVGDGINDAPALAAADVGISLAGSTDIAIETADVVLLAGGLVPLERAFAISDRAMRRVRRNIGVIIVPNAIAIALGALGLITPPIAAVINNGATIVAALVGLSPLLEKPFTRKRS